ncbi:phosphoribosylamine--glycine ligase [candidate division CSSED10-310 bacterium]|uniref:Phosphoribosylamine--glycine ligase n=1 Tax=candidate division CSSED10-310 bacterium TaxID=2855610 RepID=A0ABV6YZ35_UNCC1
MKILVIGGGGREHTLVWKIAQSSLVEKIFCCPGNAGISELAECIAVPAGGFQELKDFCLQKTVDLTIVGPEQPLVDGIVDQFTAAGLKIFGSNKAASILEGSKIFAKQFLARHNIPTASFRSFSSAASAAEYVKSTAGPWVVKADGLAAGKGVVICQEQSLALDTITSMMEQEQFGLAGKSIVIEECLQGEEGSFIVLTDGETIMPLASSQDHKPVFDGDQGPNTGGMGAYSPAPVLEGPMSQKIMTKIIQPTISGLAAEGIKFKGVLYAGLMIVDNEPFVLEFNVRFGDPETQPILTRLKSDLVPLLLASVEGNLADFSPEWRPESSILVVLAAGGYPGKYEKGKVISGLETLATEKDIIVFQAGTKISDGATVTSGGRVLGITALAETLPLAREKVYQAVEKVHFDQVHYRTDIGMKALKYLE